MVQCAPFARMLHRSRPRVEIDVCAFIAGKQAAYVGCVEWNGKLEGCTVVLPLNLSHTVDTIEGESIPTWHTSVFGSAKRKKKYQTRRR